MHYRGKVALVTGAASGIGRALAELLAKKGAITFLTDVDEEGVTSVGAVLRGRDLHASSARLDVTDATAVQAQVDRIVDEYGKLDFMFNNAGIGLAGRTHLVELEDWQRVLDVNLRGVVHGVHSAYRQMVRQRSGHIVNTASVAGLVPLPYAATYAAAKHAVVGLSTSLATEAAVHGVKVSVVCPGYIDTDIFGRTKYVGIDPKRSLASVPVRPTSATETARLILMGVERGRTIIPVTRFAWLAWLLYRLSPDLLLARLTRDAKKLVE